MEGCPKLEKAFCGPTPGLLDVFHSAPRIWECLELHDLAAIRCCSHQARALHDAACTSLNITIREGHSVPQGMSALRGIMERGCKPAALAVTARVPLPPSATYDILATCASSATRVSLHGRHHQASDIRALKQAVPSLEHLTLDLYDTAASHAADVALRAAGARLIALQLNLYGGAVLPCDGLRSCTALVELRLQLSMDRNMHIGPFKYGMQHVLYGGANRRRGGGGGGREPGHAAGGRHDGNGCDDDGGGGGAGDSGGGGDGGGGGGGGRGGGGGSGGAVGGRPVPPAVAAIASLAHLRCLELYGSAIDRVLDPPYRLTGLASLRNLTRLRIDLPADGADGFRSDSGGGGGLAGAVPEPGLYGAARAAATGIVADAGGGWRLGPTLAALTWLHDLDLGVSYSLPPEALPSLSHLSHLTRLRCGTLLTPLPQYRLPPPPPQQQQQESQQQPLPLLQLPLPSSLECLQVTSLPAVPVLAALAVLPRLRTLELERPSSWRAPVPSGSGGGGGGGSDWGGGSAAKAPAAASAARFAQQDDAAPEGVAVLAQFRSNAMPVSGVDARQVAASRVGSCCVGGVGVGGGVGGDGNGGVVRVLRAAADGQVAAGLGDGCKLEPTSSAATAAAAAATAAAAAAARPSACEPRRLTLVGEDFSHEVRDMVAAADRSEEVAVAARLLRRVLQPSTALRRLALQPFGRSPAATLEGPHAGWMAELAPLAGAVEAVEVVAFVLAPGDLGALAAALPGLKVVSLFVCRLDADDVRRLQDEHPDLTLRLDTSCEYDTCASAYGSAGRFPYCDSSDEEFVDEAEALDPDPDRDMQGVFPVAAEFQAAYERALDISDDGTDGDADVDVDGDGDDDEGPDGCRDVEADASSDGGEVGDMYGAEGAGEVVGADDELLD